MQQSMVAGRNGGAVSGRLGDRKSSDPGRISGKTNPSLPKRQSEERSASEKRDERSHQDREPPVPKAKSTKQSQS
jgi:hypothetical protein